MSYTGASFTFNQRGRMSSTTVTGVGTTNYVYNAIGQMIEKSGNGGTTLIVYDEAGHIIGEYSSTGALIEETIWMGDTPVATLQPSSGVVTLYYVHTDHLNTPRKVTRASDNILMWRWDPDAMSGVSPITSPTGRAPFTYNLLYPGQYLLNESGLYYNYFRTYDPRVGSYLESDPIGLAGGSYSTYAYAGGNALSNIDPSGLEVRYMCRPLDLTSKAHHCFVYVTCPEEGWSHVYSLFPYYILGSSARKYDMRDDPASASVTYNSLISPKSFPNESLSCQRCQFEKAVRERYDSFTSGDVFYSAAFGPNSNSFANGLLDLPTWGVSAPIVPSAPAQQFGWSLWGQPRNPSYVPARWLSAQEGVSKMVVNIGSPLRRTFLVTTGLVAASTLLFPLVGGYGTVLFQLITLNAWIAVANMTSQQFADYHHGAVIAVALVLNLAGFMVVAVPIWLLRKKMSPLVGSTVLIVWGLMYLACLFVLFRATDGP
jgi:RHS repeat-associated protein